MQLVAHLQSEGGTVRDRDYGRGRLIRDVHPGEKQTVDISLTAPKERGVYYVKFDMVCEMICWFADRGSETIQEKIEVI